MKCSWKSRSTTAVSSVLLEAGNSGTCKMLPGHGGKHRSGNLPEYIVRVNTSQSEPGNTLLLHAECMSPIMLPNSIKQVHTFLTTLPVLWRKKNPARYIWNVWKVLSICKKKRYKNSLIFHWSLPDETRGVNNKYLTAIKLTCLFN